MLVNKLCKSFGRYSRVRNAKQRKEYYEKRSEYFKRIQIMSPPNLHPSNPDITFPLNIPIRHQYIRRTINKPKLLLDYMEAQVIRFKAMTGNQILLNLENYSQMKPQELMAALFELQLRCHSLAKQVTREDIDKQTTTTTRRVDIDWNTHPTLQNVVQHMKSELANYTSREVATAILNAHLLCLQDHQLWQELQKQMLKCLPTFNKQQYLCVVQPFLTSDQGWTNSEIKQKLLQVLPNHLSQMSPKNIARLWRILDQQQLMTPYLLHQHFIMLLWKRNKWFGARYLAQFIKSLVHTHKYLEEDKDFWTVELLPCLNNMFKKEVQAQSVRSMIEALNELKLAMPSTSSQVDVLLEQAQQQLVFVQGAYQQANKQYFFNVIRDDLAFYKAQQLHNLQQNHQQSQQ